MKKKIILMAVIAWGAIGVMSCNKQVVDFTYNFDKAIITLPNGEVIEGEVDSWKDYDDGDQIQVKIDGTTYLVHSEDIALISE